MQNSCKTTNSNVSCKEPTPHGRHGHKRRKLGPAYEDRAQTEVCPEADGRSICSKQSSPINVPSQGRGLQ